MVPKVAFIPTDKNESRRAQKRGFLSDEGRADGIYGKIPPETRLLLQEWLPALSVRIQKEFLESFLINGRLRYLQSVSKIGEIMSKVCDISGKRPRVGNNVSHANNKVKRRLLEMPFLLMVRKEDAATFNVIHFPSSGI